MRGKKNLLGKKSHKHRINKSRESLFFYVENLDILKFKKVVCQIREDTVLSLFFPITKCVYRTLHSNVAQRENSNILAVFK